jgi:hypothetical protein
MSKPVMLNLADTFAASEPATNNSVMDSKHAETATTSTSSMAGRTVRVDGDVETVPASNKSWKSSVASAASTATTWVSSNASSLKDKITSVFTRKQPAAAETATTSTAATLTEAPKPITNKDLVELVLQLKPAGFVVQKHGKGKAIYVKHEDGSTRAASNDDVKAAIASSKSPAFSKSDKAGYGVLVTGLLVLAVVLGLGSRSTSRVENTSAVMPVNGTLPFNGTASMPWIISTVPNGTSSGNSTTPVEPSFKETTTTNIPYAVGSNLAAAAALVVGGGALYESNRRGKLAEKQEQIKAEVNPVAEDAADATNGGDDAPAAASSSPASNGDDDVSIEENKYDNADVKDELP